MSKRRLRHRIASLEMRLMEHEEKILKERSKSNPNERLIIHWEKEIKAFREGIERAEKRLGGGR